MLRPTSLGQSTALVLLLVAALAIHNTAAEEDLTAKCGPEFQKLSPCLPYATAKTETPSNDCCQTANGIRSRDPVCLCYIIQQAAKGSSSNIGLQFDRILKLSSACSIPNANASLCPRLLKIPAGSPEIAIFNGSAPLLTSTPTMASGSVARTDFVSIMIAVVSAVASSLF